MAEISINEYIRTDNGIIIKYQFLEKSESFEVFFGQKGKGFTFEDMEEFEDFINQRVVKHSKDIIDLVEVGDYVNGYIVLDIMEDIKTGELHLEMPMDYTNKELGDCTIYNKDIKSIVTKEQFSQMEYKLEE